MKLFSNRKKEDGQDGAAVQTAASASLSHPFSALLSYAPLSRAEFALFEEMREAIPVIDAAISKLRRLLGSFEVVCGDRRAQKALDRFLRDVPVGGVSQGVNQFIYTYLDQLLTFGSAIGEIVMDEQGTEIRALYNANWKDVELRSGENPLDVRVFVRGFSGQAEEAAHQERILVTLLNPVPGSVRGTSVMKGLPYVSTIFLKVLDSMGQNFDRVGNVRFAVTYKPPANASAVSSKHKAEEIAREWSKAMRDRSKICDFVSVGDVSIKAIGADNQTLDFEAPVRLLTEQIVAKLSIPPFMLGLSWSTTERMSTQQADILMSELQYYRSLLSPAILKIARTFLRTEGYDDDAEVRWSEIELMDETESADARLSNAQAALLERELENDPEDAQDKPGDNSGKSKQAELVPQTKELT